MRRLYNFLSNYERRKIRNRKKLNGNFRISLFKSNRHFYAQLIDDTKSITLTSASTLDPKIRDACKSKVNANSVRQVASLMAERLSGVKLDQQIIFDCGAYKYTGVISQFAEVLRNAGLRF
ncbi:50S ribosomal protein L18 [Wolbachia pipientis]|uniref:Large ribosomal subunit protein uL18 n=1 Tax=Wolbachia pipientis TaxID=955 RepID=A0A1E7QIU6_WOLPI|nr:50S ribosomal protein L18 [Wolbachia pipientis]OEY86393.1 50S ribosomal protein L18 [Wolbachia pipientis]